MPIIYLFQVCGEPLVIHCLRALLSCSRNPSEKGGDGTQWDNKGTEDLQKWLHSSSRDSFFLTKAFEEGSDRLITKIVLVCDNIDTAGKMVKEAGMENLVQVIEVSVL